MNLNYADIKYCDVANGKGVRVSLLSAAVPITVKDVLMKKHGIFSMESLLRKIRSGRSWLIWTDLILQV